MLEDNNRYRFEEEENVQEENTLEEETEVIEDDSQEGE